MGELTSMAKGFFILFGLALAAFAVGGIIGYFNGSSGADGSSERGISWAVRTGLLLLGMMIVISILGAAVFPRLKLPPIIGWSLVMGIGFAIMSGGGVLLGMNGKHFWHETFNGFLSGAFIGAIAGPVIQRNQSRHNHTSSSESSDLD